MVDFDEEDVHLLSFDESERNRQVTIRVVIEGRVQGVGFRNWMTQRAKDGGISGWVRNRTNATVEALLHGDENVVHELIQMCYHGPPLAYVQRVKEFPERGNITRFTSFSLLPTA